MKSIGEKARIFRESRGWNTTEMAKAVGTSRQSIENLEAAGDRKPRYVKDLARVMGCTVDELYGASSAAPSTRHTPRDNSLTEHLVALEIAIEELAPILKPAGQDALKKWVGGDSSASDAAATLEALSVASMALASGNRKSA